MITDILLEFSFSYLYFLLLPVTYLDLGQPTLKILVLLSNSVFNMSEIIAVVHRT